MAVQPKNCFLLFQKNEATTLSICTAKTLANLLNPFIMFYHVRSLINEIIPDEPDPSAANAL